MNSEYLPLEENSHKVSLAQIQSDLQEDLSTSTFQKVLLLLLRG